MKETRKKDLSQTVSMEHPRKATAVAAGDVRTGYPESPATSAASLTSHVPSRSKPPSKLPEWKEFLALLRGLGLLSSQLNDYRLYLPVDLRRRLGGLLELPWVISFWCEGCLRVVPQYLWFNYVERLRQETQRLGEVDLVDEAVVQPASVIQLEHGGRWHLPHSLAGLGKIDGSSLCLLCPGEGGIEIWDAAVKQERLRTIVGKLDHKLVAISRTPHFAAFESSNPPLRQASPEPVRALQEDGHVA